MVEEHNHEHEEKEVDYITVVDEEGNESLYEILFTFDSQDYGKSYVLIYPAGTSDEEEVEIQAYAYKENADGTSGDLEAIETEEEWDMIDEVLNTFLADDEE
ncbi:DUF1292 domain-containing protein [Facklamia sp. 7083-14-GEN3]|uniref:DUF1292 domain-containing protein n=1 Tax=Facklamia sp. 7083-14-GEN3 TaxID=2973478 RepID=UPI00215C08DA|nr:DUF1292 domain-containing protein [Facklamia sp. 7083-14-GEN3]MCR8969097.1 DUF1292 domain-containing protein [Facklamia sp. 7083-14-GEN3]